MISQIFSEVLLNEPDVAHLFVACSFRLGYFQRSYLFKIPITFNGFKMFVIALSHKILIKNIPVYQTHCDATETDSPKVMCQIF